MLLDADQKVISSSKRALQRPKDKKITINFVKSEISEIGKYVVI
jgi:hypothetical protein